MSHALRAARRMVGLLPALALGGCPLAEAPPVVSVAAVDVDGVGASTAPFLAGAMSLGHADFRERMASLRNRFTPTGYAAYGVVVREVEDLAVDGRRDVAVVVDGPVRVVEVPATQVASPRWKVSFPVRATYSGAAPSKGDTKAPASGRLGVKAVVVRSGEGTDGLLVEDLDAMPIKDER